MGFRITTWNVNGIRNPFGYQPWREQRTFQAMFEILEADIVIMQETKIQRKDLRDDMVLVPGWDVFFSLPRHKKGYSGVAIYTKNATCAPIRAEEGVTGILTSPRSTTSFRDLPRDQQIGGYPRPGQLSGAVDEVLLDSEGRCMILEFPAFVLFGVYSPANRDESRDEFRTSFFEALDIRIRNLVAEGKEVILTGDLNVIRSSIDSSNVAGMLQKEDMSMDEWMSLPTRRVFNQLIFEGTVKGERDEGREQPVLWDLCRCFHPDRIGMHTCWDTKRNTRPANLGSRIDYVLCSAGLKDWFTSANIQEGLMGSDHCPVYATMADSISRHGQTLPLDEVMNPSDMFRDGKRVREWEQRDVLALSAKLIPEFDRRQSIRDMFTRKGTSSPLSQATQNSISDTAPKPPSTVLSAAEVDAAIVAQQTQPGLNLDATSQGESEAKISQAYEAPKATLVKRNITATENSNPPAKRTKGPGDGSSNPKSKVGPGQRTLQGFFKPKVQAAAEASVKGQDRLDEKGKPSVVTDRLVEGGVAGTNGASKQTATPPTVASVFQKTPPKRMSSPERVFDPIENKESWSKLLGKRVVPKCEHNEPCISLVTKKAGVNCVNQSIGAENKFSSSKCSVADMIHGSFGATGRSFYICPRPLGPSGEKEKGSEWRCGTFIWSSDWNSASS